MAPAILLVDDQHDVLRLLHSALDSLKHPELEVLEAASGEEAAQQVRRRKIDLLVSEYALPGMTGVELMHTVRARQPDVKVIVITGSKDRKVRDEILNAGALAVFGKPVPLADFLNTVERGLGLVRTIFPAELEEQPESGPARFSDLLANLRQDLHANAVFLVNNRGLVVARAGALLDSSMEVSLVSALTAMFGAGLKVARANRQEGLDQFCVFSGGDHDLILIPVDASYSLLLAGEGVASRGILPDTIQAMVAVRDEVGRSLRSIGATRPAKETPAAAAPKKQVKAGDLAAASAAPDLAALLEEAGSSKITQEDMDAFWEQAAERHANKPTDPDVISYEQARKLGLTPDPK